MSDCTENEHATEEEMMTYRPIERFTCGFCGKPIKRPEPQITQAIESLQATVTTKETDDGNR